MMHIGGVIGNRTICDLFGVANMGGIRVSKARNHIVLISNNTDPTYRNEWKDDVLHFVGMGSIGPQKLNRQNRTLANAGKSGATLYLFEVFENSRYVYAGEVELAGEPYLSDQRDARAESRFVWIFPLRRKPEAKTGKAVQDEPKGVSHLPQGAYAVIGSDLREDQIDLVNRLLDQLKQNDVPVFDGRDVDRQRYERALGRWHEEVLDQARSIVRGLIIKKKRAGKADSRHVGVVDNELEISSRSTESELRDALKFLDLDDRTSTEAIFEDARCRVPMPEVPKSLIVNTATESIEDMERPKGRLSPIHRSKLDGFT